MLMLPLPYVVAFSPPTHAHPPTTAPNMNGAYELSKTPGAPSGASFPTNFKDYPGGVESFDVYHGPITTQYSQVWWASTSNPLPDDIVQRFDGSAIAIVGLEMDQVRRTPQGDVSVPITVAYNHHHDTAVVGKGAHLVEVERDDPRLAKAGRKHIRLSGMKAGLTLTLTLTLALILTLTLTLTLTLPLTLTLTLTLPLTLTHMHTQA